MTTGDTPAKSAGHMASVALLFVVFALLAALLHVFIAWIETWADSVALIYVLKFVKFAILAADTALVLRVIWKSLVAAFKGGG